MASEAGGAGAEGPAGPQAAPRSEGQWACGDRTPLNDVEACKAAEAPTAVRDRLLAGAAAGSGSPPLAEEDLKVRLRLWGLHDQRPAGAGHGSRAQAGAGHGGRAQAGAGGEAAFMLRVRTDGGALGLEQLRVLAGIATDHGRGTADLTSRQGVQFHWIRAGDLPAIWARLAAVGLDSVQSGGDGPHAIVGSPLAGIDPDEVLDATPAIEEIRRRFVGQEELFNLPRKFNTAICGSPRLDVAYEINDLAFVGEVHPRLGPGFDLQVGGGLGARPGSAQRLGTWVPLAEVPQVWLAVLRLFREHGYRRLRSRSRLRFLLADWGVPAFREVLERDYLERPLPDGPAPAGHGRSDLSGVHAQRDGLCWVGAVPLLGRLTGGNLPGLVAAMERAGSTRLRLTPGQKLIVLDVPAANVTRLVEDLAALDLPVRASAFRRGAMACTGIEFCRKGVVETKATAANLVTELETRFADRSEVFGPDAPAFALHLDGCPNSCTRAQLADLGLSGVLVRDPARGERAVAEGVQVFLGGGLGDGPGFGRHLRGLKIPSADLPEVTERLLRHWLAQRADGEPFAEWAHRDGGEELFGP